MKTYCCLLLLGLLVVSGCTHHYVLTLSNGTQVGSHNKPKLKDGVYYFTDALGRSTSVPATRVKEIEPASMAKSPSTTSK